MLPQFFNNKSVGGAPVGAGRTKQSNLPSKGIMSFLRPVKDRHAAEAHPDEEAAEDDALQLLPLFLPSERQAQLQC